MVDESEILFPHENVRKIQDEMLKEVVDSLKNKKNMIIHAPTGIGKTVSVIAPALSFALKNDLTIFFLTSRHTQHKIAIDTLKEIRKKYENKFTVVDLLGKRWMCLQPGIETLYSSDFADYCKKLREENECEFYTNIKSKNKLSPKAKKVLQDLKDIGPMHAEDMIKHCRKEKLCPYEMSALLLKDSNLVIGDYYYIFDEFIRNNLFKRADKEIEKSIIIVDEGHNLPNRIRNLMTAKLTNNIIERALKEAKKFGYNETLRNIEMVKEALNDISNDLNFNKEEKLVRKHEFSDKIEDYDEVLSDLVFIGDEIREKQKKSYIGSIGFFLELWQGPDDGFVRIISKKENYDEPFVLLSYRCLDPSIFTKKVIDDSYSTIIMSGTLTPTFMYKDILGFNNVVEKVYKSPFPKKNSLNLIIPETTTKYNRRNENEFKRIGELCAKLVNLIPGNSLLFFPSYGLRDKIYTHFFQKSEKTIFLEKPNLTKEEKEEMLKKFGSYKKTGATLLGVASGSFGEGIDLPGDLVKGVIVVGLPLERPSLEIKEVIEYYDEKFSKGWDYGYIFPGIIKSLQNAGRCIRSETDKGVIMFVDERFAWPSYIRCFPPDMDVKITKLYEEKIKDFFT